MKITVEKEQVFINDEPGFVKFWVKKSSDDITGFDKYVQFTEEEFKELAVQVQKFLREDQ